MRGAAGEVRMGRSPSGFGELGSKSRKQPRSAKSVRQNEKAKSGKKLGELRKEDWARRIGIGTETSEKRLARLPRGTADSERERAFRRAMLLVRGLVGLRHRSQ